MPIVALILRGDTNLNVIKAERLEEVKSPLQFAEEEGLKSNWLWSGFIRSSQLTIPFVVDRDAAQLADFACGANEEGYHFVNVNWGEMWRYQRLQICVMCVKGFKSRR